MLYLTLRHYEYVCATAHHGSLSAAAEALHVSQPALSAALSRIEEQLGKQLFQRKRGAPLTLTTEGRAFAEKAQALVEQAARLEAPDAPAPITQKLKLGCFSDLAPFCLAPALRQLRAELPGLAVYSQVLGFSELTDGMMQGKIDLAITYDLGLDAGFEREMLGERQPQALVSPSHVLAKESRVTLKQLAKEPLILSQEGLSVQHMLGLFRTQGLLPRIVHRAASLELLRSLAANGEGVGISYSSPPTPISYDGKTIVALPIADDSAREAVILTSHGTPPAESPQEQAHIILRDLFKRERPI